MNTAKKPKLKIKYEYILVIILIVVVVAIFLSSVGKDNLGVFKSSSTTQKTYQDTLEEKLTGVISQIKGAGKTKVIVSLDGSSEEVVLKNTQTITENGIKTTTDSIVLINGKPYAIKSLNPTVLGVVIVCEGADDIEVKIAITEVVNTILNLSSENIRIIKMK